MLRCVKKKSFDIQHILRYGISCINISTDMLLITQKTCALFC